MGVRPSELMGVTEAWPAYCFDSACFLWGTTIEQEMDVAASQTKKQNMKAARRFQVLARFIDLPDHMRFKSASPTRRK